MLFRFQAFYLICHPRILIFFFFFNDTATTEIYTLSLHDALPILHHDLARLHLHGLAARIGERLVEHEARGVRSEEHTSELQSLAYLVCRLLLEKKKKNKTDTHPPIQNIHSNHQHSTSNRTILPCR